MASLPPLSSVRFTTATPSPLIPSNRSDSDKSTLRAALLERVAEDDPDAVESLQEKFDAQDALSRQLDAMPDPGDRAKARAREKIERIKQKLQALRMLAAVNPEAAARQAAQLAKELASATKEYANAGGGSLGGVATGAQTPDTTVPSSPDASALPVAATTGAETAAVDGAAPQTDAPSEEPEGVSPTENGEDREETAPSEESLEARLDRILHAVQDGLAQQIQEQREKNDGAQADRDFASEVNRIKSALKSILETAKRAMETQGDNPDLAQGDRALREVESALSDIQIQIGAKTGTIDIQV